MYVYVRVCVYSVETRCKSMIHTMTKAKPVFTENNTLAGLLIVMFYVTLERSMHGSTEISSPFRNARD